MSFFVVFFTHVLGKAFKCLVQFIVFFENVLPLTHNTLLEDIVEIVFRFKIPNH